MFFRELWSPGLNWDANKSSVRGHVTKKTKCSGFKTWRWTQQSETCLRVFKTKSTALWNFFSKKWETYGRCQRISIYRSEARIYRSSLTVHKDCPRKKCRVMMIYFFTSYIMYALWSLWSVLTFWVERGESTQCVHQSKLQRQSCQEMGKNFEACSRLTIFSPKYDHLWGFYRALFRPLRAEIELYPTNKTSIAGNRDELVKTWICQRVHSLFLIFCFLLLLFDLVWVFKIDFVTIYFVLDFRAFRRNTFHATLLKINRVFLLLWPDLGEVNKKGFQVHIFDPPHFTN